MGPEGPHINLTLPFLVLFCFCFCFGFCPFFVGLLFGVCCNTPTRPTNKQEEKKTKPLVFRFFGDHKDLQTILLCCLCSCDFFAKSFFAFPFIERFKRSFSLFILDPFEKRKLPTSVILCFPRFLLKVGHKSPLLAPKTLFSAEISKFSRNKLMVDQLST